MLVALQSGVNVDRVIVLVKERQLVEKIQVLGRYAALNRPARLIEVLFARYRQRLACILGKGPLAARNRSYPKVGAALDKIKQHLFVIAAQAMHLLRVLAA